MPHPRPHEEICDAEPRAERRAEARSSRLLRYALALVFLWFGALKLRPQGSAAEVLAEDTINHLTGGRVRGRGVRALGVLECTVGLALLSGRMLRVTLAVMGLHLTGASSPLVVFPRRCFTRPWRPTLEGQYIVKNVVLAAAGLELAARSGRQSRLSPPADNARTEGNR